MAKINRIFEKSNDLINMKVSIDDIIPRVEELFDPSSGYNATSAKSRQNRPRKSITKSMKESHRRYEDKKRKEFEIEFKKLKTAFTDSRENEPVDDKTKAGEYPGVPIRERNVRVKGFFIKLNNNNNLI